MKKRCDFQITMILFLSGFGALIEWSFYELSELVKNPSHTAYAAALGLSGICFIMTIIYVVRLFRHK